MKKFLTTILFTCLVVASYAQSGKVTMSVIDSQSKQAVIGAVVSIAPAAKLDDAKHFTTGDNGKVVIPAQKYGDYKLTITFLGYDDLEMDLKINMHIHFTNNNPPVFAYMRRQPPLHKGA